MRTYDVFKEYIWLVNTIRKAGKISLAEINEKWCETDMSGGLELARSTFNRHKDAIQDIFGIYIECDRKAGHKYYIGNSRVLDEDSVQNWMISTLTVNNMLSESMAMRERILLESVPSEGEYLQTIIEAMQKSVRIAVDYQRYSAAAPRHLTMEPYCLKLFRQRWYMLGHFHRDATAEKPEADYFGIFSLDRIKTLELTNIKFKVKKDFNAKDYFNEYFGVTTGDGTECERAIALDNDLARSNIADIYRKGTGGVEKDLVKAFDLYKVCKLPYAYYRVGEAYEHGWGVEQNEDAAKYNYLVAYKAGHPLARKKLREWNFLR